MEKKILVATLFTLPLMLSACCMKSEAELKELNTRTPKQQEQADKLYDMGEAPDRSKSKGY